MKGLHDMQMKGCLLHSSINTYGFLKSTLEWELLNGPLGHCWGLEYVSLWAQIKVVDRKPRPKSVSFFAHIKTTTPHDSVAATRWEVGFTIFVKLMRETKWNFLSYNMTSQYIKKGKARSLRSPPIHVLQLQY
jgi:hypothetical protein